MDPAVDPLPGHRAFKTNMQLRHFGFPTDPYKCYFAAPGGSFSKVLLARHKDNFDVAVKVLVASGTSRKVFNAEVEKLIIVRSQVDIIRELAKRSIALTPGQRGAFHVAYLYGTGEEECLSDFDGNLPVEKAFLITVEPLVATLEQAFILTPPAPPLRTLLRVAHDVGKGLAFLSSLGIVVRLACLVIFPPLDVCNPTFLAAL